MNIGGHFACGSLCISIRFSAKVVDDGADVGGLSVFAGTRSRLVGFVKHCCVKHINVRINAEMII